MPVCQNTTEEDCFEQVLETYAREQVPMKPCTKYQYDIEEKCSLYGILIFRWAPPLQMTLTDDR